VHIAHLGGRPACLGPVLYPRAAKDDRLGAIAGLRRKLSLLESVRDLPDYGRPTGRGYTANLENVLKFKPDQIDPSEQQVDALLASATASKRER